MKGSRVAGLICAVLAMGSAVVATPGDLDPSFGTEGKVITGIGSGNASINAMVLQPDGKLVVAGNCTSGSNKDFAVARYLSNGTLDDSFGTNGVVTTDFGNSTDEAYGVALQSDGKILVVGGSLNGTTSNFALARYDSNGTLDTDFGGGTGKIKTIIGSNSTGTQARGVKVQDDGKILVVGSLNATADFALVRYSNNGSLDNGFGTGGVVSTDFSGQADYGQGLVLQSDGKIVVGGHAKTSPNFAATRYLANGTLDSSFGTGGKFNGTIGNCSYSLVLQSDGKIVLAGYVGSTADFCLARLGVNGTLDTSFNGTGVVTTPVGTAADVAYGLALQSDGKLMAAGYAFNANTNYNEFALVRYLANGTVDTGFHGIGKVTTGFSTGNASCRSVMVDPDGRIVVAGYAHDGAKNNFVLARYLGAGNLSITAPRYGSYTGSSLPVISGRADADSSIDVFLDGSAAGTTVADGAGEWSFTPSSALADGNHTVSVTSGSFTDTASFKVDTAAPGAPVIVTPAEGTLINTSWPVIGGTAEAGATVTIYVDEVAAGTAVANGSGNWSFTPSSALGNGPHTERATATDPAGNTGTSCSAVNFSTSAALFGSPGNLDPSFGTGGKVVTVIGSGNATINAMVLQPDGKLVVAGNYTNGSTKDFAVARYLTNGTLDDSFGMNGVLTTDFGNTTDEAYGVALQSDGKIIVAGRALAGTTNSVFALARYNPNGSLDTSFGTAGTGKVKTTVGSSGSSNQATSVRLQTDGKICVAGYANILAIDFVVLRYNCDGTLDGSFGAGGLASMNRPGNERYGGNSEYGRGLALRSDGKILVCGKSTGYMSSKLVIASFNADGTPDTGFSGDAMLSFDSADDWYALAMQSDGNIVAAGTTGTSPNFVLNRYSANGTTDTSFGTSGAVTTGVGTAADVAYGLAVQSDDKLVAAGYSYNANNNLNDFALVRYTANGTLDTSFLGTGKVTTGFGGNAQGRCVAISSDGRIIVAGYANDGTRNNFALARYFAEGSLTITAPVNGLCAGNSLPIISGRADPGLTVNVFLDGSVVGTTVADGSGAWSFTPTTVLVDGVHTVAVTETDAYGYTGPLSNSVSFKVDTAAPGVPLIMSPGEGTLVNTSWPVIGGTAEAGATVTVYVDELAVGTTVVNGSGNWSLTPLSALGVGPHTVKATVTDFAGNTGVFSSIVSFSTSAALFGGPGNLDPSFGTDGKVITTIGSGNASINAMVLQPDGKLVVAGNCTVGSNKDFAVARYLSNGTLDDSFGTNGVVSTDFGNTTDEAYGVALQGDGKIIVVGRALTTRSVFALARYDSNGTLDNTFGPDGTGRIKTVVGSNNTETKARAVKVQADGKICVAGYADILEIDFVVLRYNSDGTLDDSFGAGGLASMNRMGSQGYASEYGYGLALRSDGKSFVCGNSSGYLSDLAAIASFNADGTPDTGFDGDGLLTFSSAGDWNAVATQSDGKIVTAGTTGTPPDFVLNRYSANGTQDTTFDKDGTVKTSVGTADDVAYGLAVQSDDKLVAAGYSYNANADLNDFALVRYTANGTLDTSFLGTGKVTTGFSGCDAQGRCVVIGSDGRIIVAGYANDGTRNNFALVRYFGTNQPPAVNTGEATGIVRTGAVLNGMVNPNSLPTTAHFEYGLTASYGNVTSNVALGAGPMEVATNSTIGGLTDNTIYHYRLVATNQVGTTYGQDMTFNTAPNPPLAFTGSATGVTSSTATLVGVVLPNGRVTNAYFEYGLSTAYGTLTPAQTIPANGTIVDVFAPLTGLVAGATYHFRVVAVNAGSPIAIAGEDITFVANNPVPSVETGEVSQLTTTSVQLTGTACANNADADVYFDYGTDGVNFPNSVAANPAMVTGNANVSVNATLINLTQAATYYYRIRAVNDGGTSMGSNGSFTLNVLSGLAQVFPGAPPEADGYVFVLLSPAGIGGGWRFVGEQQWRSSGISVGGLTTGDRQIEFRPVPGYIHPLPEIISVVSGGETTVVTGEYYPTPVGDAGGLSVVIKPESLADPGLPVEQRAQWRLLGENDAQWRDSGAAVEGLFPGNYLIECKPITGRTTPAVMTVLVASNSNTLATATYFLAAAATGTQPSVLSFDTVSANEAMPYAYVGQIRSDVGSSSGFVVKPRVVATAAHVVFDDGTLSYVTGLQWLFQRDRGTYEPTPQVPRGFYVFDGYAAQRTADNSPGVSTPQSQHLDVAAMYFLEDAARGGYGGWLASDLDDNEFLLSNKLKMLVGYPVDGIPANRQGRMHATPPANVTFSRGYGRTFTTSAIRSAGGASGGPLCIQADNGNYYPAAVYLGGSAQTVVRAIDSPVIDLFNRAEVSGDGGDNNSSGGITHYNTPFAGGSANIGGIRMTIQPEEAVAAGAKWMMGSAIYTSGMIADNLWAGLSYTISFSSAAGFLPQANITVTVANGTVSPLTRIYFGITQHPAGLTATTGGNATFTVGVSGTPTAYQWLRNGSSIPGATSSNYTITAVALADAANYSVAVTWGPDGSVTSNAAPLNVVQAQDYDNWRGQKFDASESLDPLLSGAMADFDQDGVNNLKEFAYNLDPKNNDARVMMAGNGTSGLPLGQVESIGGQPRLTLEYVRRKTSTSPGITYTVEFNSNLLNNAGWSATGNESVTSINATWERVKVTDAHSNSTTRFGRVTVTQP